MALLRYRAEEARNIAKAQKAAEQTARIEGSLAKKLTDAEAASLQAQIDDKEPTITAGSASQYWRGDKTFQTLDKAAVGLGNVDNTSDADKPVSTATQTALNTKSSLVTLQTIATDADATVTATVSRYQVFHTGTLTAGRTLTLSSSGVSSGWTMRFTRTGAGAFNLSIGGLKNLTTNTWCDVVYNGSAWVLTASGSL